MNKKKIIISSVIVLAILCFIIGYYICAKITDYSPVIKANWNIDFAAYTDIIEIYGIDNVKSILGDGNRYHIFQYENEDGVSEMLDWSNEEKETIYNSTYTESVNEWLGQIGVPEEYYPDYSSCKYWYNKKEDNSEIIILWDDTEDKLYVVESFM